ncbi:dinitrogenase iron-molybdenum cofactor [Candidatus Methanoplasma termitum]|uniref:Dinitrogenase iron-molybdenum cofactor n=1 Tax=Candidatus Methanoplasma termitum TaxID=1577791 RepID=A0A0A7LF21_9ARCH|nr:NifB/NifX family molybdenum-iron cluster-binding protein [Candidatus Methanoplasma termitum]AIZ56081.1 dinitrogenase iron-molybdenum cofactor [Candidatus Methanoplasma termitum]
MKIGVIAEGDTLESYVAEDFGHAPFFLIVDMDTLDYTVVKNEFANSNGAGFKVADAIVGLKVDAVIVGGIGSHGLQILNKAEIQVSYDEDGTVEQCVKDFKRRYELKKKFENKSN